MAQAPNKSLNQLGQNVVYVNPDGSLTPEFIRQWNKQRTVNGDSTALIEALQSQINEILGAAITGADGLAGGGLLASAPLTITLPNIAPPLTVGPWGDATNVPQFTVDAKGRITSVVNVPVSGGGGGGAAYFSGTAVIGTVTVSGSAAATKVLKFTPTADIEVAHIWAWIDPGATTDTYYAQISTQSGANVGTVLGQTATTAAVGFTDQNHVRMSFATSVTLTAGTTYLISVTWANAPLGTSVLRIGAFVANTGAMSMDAPGTIPWTAPTFAVASIGLTNGQALPAAGADGGRFVMWLEGAVDSAALSDVFVDYVLKAESGVLLNTGDGSFLNVGD